MDEGIEEIPTAAWYIWLFLIVVAGISFWCQVRIKSHGRWMCNRLDMSK